MKKILAVTACPTGIAHTYMSAEALQKAADEKNAGFHLRPAQLFVEKANRFQSQLKVKTQTGTEVNPKSILGLMTLGLEQGAKMIIEADGADEIEAVNGLVELVESKFGES